MTDNQTKPLVLDMIAVSFATRLLMSQLDRDVMLRRAVEGVLDFGRTRRSSILILGPGGNSISHYAGMAADGYCSGEIDLPVAETPLQRVMERRKPLVFGLVEKEGLPWPDEKQAMRENQCLCAPLIAADNKMIGFVTLMHPVGESLKADRWLPLIQYLNVVGIALETTRLFQLAVVDGLTGLYGRRYFDIRMDEEEVRVSRYGGDVALLVIDIDHFKKVNDTYGHQQGDGVLRQLAQVIKTGIRQHCDIPFRYGGEEFVVLMPNTQLAEASAVAERLRRSCARLNFVGPRGEIKVTISCGVAHMDQVGDFNGVELFALADAALYQAKSGGRNRVVVAED